LSEQKDDGMKSEKPSLALRLLICILLMEVEDGYPGGLDKMIEDMEELKKTEAPHES